MTVPYTQMIKILAFEVSDNGGQAEAKTQAISQAVNDKIEKADQDVVAVDNKVGAESNLVEVFSPKITSLGLGSVFIPPLDKTQKKLLDTPVDLIPQKMLFSPMPLAARLASSNVTYV